MKTSDFNYDLPAGLIAQEPVEPRDSSRLMVYQRDTGTIHHSRFSDIGKFLNPGDLLVVNETRVIPARLYARKIPSGGRVEILLLKKLDILGWEALVGGKGLSPGKSIRLEDGPRATIESEMGGSRRLIKFEIPIEPLLERIGHVPLPPYIHTPLSDPQRYQTVFAQSPGSAAAPTAGLHFTPGLISGLKEQGVNFCTITLHIGLDTFAPVTEDFPEQHQIHTEWCLVDEQAAKQINESNRKGAKIVAVGTTSVRALESASNYATDDSIVGSFTAPTDLFILPGYSFRVVNAMVTNFHLPRSTLLMLVSAFVGLGQIMDLYEQAIKDGYRFYSFGDAMLIL